MGVMKKKGMRVVVVVVMISRLTHRENLLVSYYQLRLDEAC